MSNVPQKKNNLVKIIGIIVVVAIIAYGVFKYVKKDEAPSENNPAGGTVPALGEGNGEETSMFYADGTYTATGNYISPGGAEEIGVTITLQDGVIVNAKVETRATRPTSVKMQTAFEAGFAVFVIGKNIDEVELDKVSGSSLTPKGFNEALVEIKAQAQAAV